MGVCVWNFFFNHSDHYVILCYILMEKYAAVLRLKRPILHAQFVLWQKWITAIPMQRNLLPGDTESYISFH